MRVVRACVRIDEWLFTQSSKSQPKDILEKWYQVKYHFVLFITFMNIGHVQCIVHPFFPFSLMLYSVVFFLAFAIEFFLSFGTNFE